MKWLRVFRAVTAAWLQVGLLITGSLLLCVASGAQPVTVTNVFQNHYHYGFPVGNQDCPSGHNVPAGQYPSTYHLERGHFIHHLDPKNATNDYWVYWAHFENSNYTTAEVAVFKSTTECGPYMLQTNLYPQYNVDGSGYGFQPGGWQSRDDNIFRDSDQTYNADGTVASYASSYLISASNDLGTQTSSHGTTCSYANDSIAIFKMTPDYLGIDASTNTNTNGANWMFVCDQREAPVMFHKGSKYFLVTSQAAGWYPSQGGYGVSSSPLAGWTPDPLPLGNTSTFGLQTADGFTIEGTQANTYVLSFDHLGGSDSKNPASGEKTDTGNVLLPLLLDDTAGTATLNWYSSWTVDNTTGVLTLPTVTNLALNSTASSTVASAAASGSTTYVPANAFDGDYLTRWQDTHSGSSAFNPVTSTTGTLCPVTGATSTTTCNPSLITDLGSVQPVQEIDLSWYMVHGSESYYTFKIAYSSDDVTWNTLDYTAFASASNATAQNISSVPFSNNILYGFNALPVNFSARYVALLETSVVQQNTSSPFYAPNVYEMGVIQSTAPQSPQQAQVTVTPSVTSASPGSAFTVAVSVTGTGGQSLPTGYVQLSAPGYISETYGLVNGANSFTIPAGALGGGNDTITVNYRPDPTSAPVYGLGTVAGTASVSITAPDAPTNLTVTPTGPNALTAAWTASLGATSYTVMRSTDGGNSFTPATTTSATTYQDTGLISGASYCYEVAAVNAAGPGSPTAPVCSAASTSFPVTNISVAPLGPGGLNISYDALANATGYVIKRSTSGGAYATLATTAATSYTDSGLAVDGTNYCYTVAAVFSTGTASDSAPVCAQASADTSPTTLQVTPWADGQLYLSWAVNGSATSYIVKRSINGGVFTALPSQAALTYTDIGLTDYADVYCYTVAEALNGVTSTDSAAVCAVATGNFVPVADFSFESPSVGLWSTQTSFLNANGGYGWTFAGNGSNAGNNSGVSAVSGTFTNKNTPNIALGHQVGVLEGTGVVTQDIALTPGQTYTILVTASERQASLQSGGAEPFQIAWNGTVIASFSPLQSIPYYRDYSATFTASQTSNALTLAGTSSSGSSAVLIDNVRIVATGNNSLALTAQPETVALGTSTVTLTASAQLGGTVAPASAMIFQVNGGSQQPGTCLLSGSAYTCSITYSTATLAAGTYPVNVTFEGDTNYAAASASTTLTVNSSSTGIVQLISTTALSRLSDGSYQAIVSVRNSGTATAASVALNTMSLGGASGSPTPATMGDIDPGGTATVTLSVPASAGASGNAVAERFNGTYSGGVFGGSMRARLP